MFFIISGYLVTASWVNDPSVAAFLRKRAARIWPGLLTVVLLSTLVVGPLATTLPIADYLAHPETRRYLWTGLMVDQMSLPGVFEHNPMAGVVNGSLWTLPVEVAAYAVLVIVAAVTIRQSRRWPIPFITALFTTGSYATADTYASGLAAMFALFFMASTVYLYGLTRRRWAVIVATVGLLASLGTSFSLIGMIALVYLVLYGATAYVPALRHTSKFGDPSYGIYIYGFPIAQMLVLAGVDTFGTMFVLSFTLSLAAGYASWHLIEKPALRWLKTIGNRPANDGRPVLGVAAASIR